MVVRSVQPVNRSARRATNRMIDSTPPLPLIVFITAFAIGGVVFLFFLLRSDLRRRYQADGVPRTDGGGNSSVAVVELPLTPGEAQAIAVDAMRSVGETNDVVVAGDTILAWTKTPFLATLGWVPQQLSIQVIPTAAGAQCLCRSRPRHSLTVSDLGRSQTMVDKLASTLKELATG